MLSKSVKYSIAVALCLAGLSAVALTSPAEARGGAKNSTAQGHNGSQGQGPQVITLRVCNRTGVTVMIASNYIPIGRTDWINKGWTAVRSGACQAMFKTTNSIFYVRAEKKNDSGTSWGDDIDQCVEYPGPYSFYTRTEDTHCPEGEPAKFEKFESDGTPTYTWNLK